MGVFDSRGIKWRIMARAKKKFSEIVPKLIFRDGDSTGGETLKETKVELNWVNVSHSRSFKTVFLGDSNVGKTCIARLFVHGEVAESTTNTIGFDHHVKEMDIEDGLSVKLQIWDTAGMEQFRNALITKYYRNADGIVLVYDITRRKTFENIELWIQEVRQYCSGGMERIRMILIGNKLDLQDKREVSPDDAQSLVQRYKMTHFIELTAKKLSELTKLEDAFINLSRHMNSIREQTELTKSAKRSESVIQLEGSEGWEIILTPDEPIPQHVYGPQDSRRKKCSRC